jgi:hypothetical protein
VAEAFLHDRATPGRQMVKMLSILVDATNPLGGAGLNLQTFAPSAVDAAVALAENKDWTNRPIYKENFSSLDPTPGFRRTKDSATGFSKSLSWVLNKTTGGTEYTPGLFSPTPDQIDYILSQAGGGVTREIVKAATLVGNVGSGEDYPAYKVPLISRFYGESEGATQTATRFYDNIKRMNEHKREVEGRKKDREPGLDYLLNNPEARLTTMAGKVELSISKLHQRLDALRVRGVEEGRLKPIKDQITTKMAQFNERVELLSK